MSRVVWTEDRLSSLRAHLGNGLTAPQIAREMGTTDHAIHCAMRRHGMVRAECAAHAPIKHQVKWTPGALALAQNLLDGGYTVEAVARRMHRTQNALRSALNRHGMPGQPPRKPEWTTRQDALFREMYKNGARLTEIADACGRTRVAVNHRVDWLGLRKDKRLMRIRMTNRKARTEQKRRAYDLRRRFGKA